MNYIFHLATMVAIYWILSTSLNLLVGYTGLISLSHAAFYGLSAYIGSLLIVKASVNYFVAMILAIIAVVFVSGAIAMISLRFKGDYYVLASLGFQTIIFVLLYNWTELTGGAYGLSGIPRPALFGVELDSIGAYFIYTAVIAAICFCLIYCLCSSPFGRALKAIRENALAAEALGKRVFRLKVIVSMISAGFAAVGGMLFAGYASYLNPTSFTLTESIFILSIVIIGGAGSLRGSFIGTILLVLLPEILRFVGFPESAAAHLRQIIYGLIIIFLMRRCPEGLAGQYRFE